MIQNNSKYRVSISNGCAMLCIWNWICPTFFLLKVSPQSAVCCCLLFAAAAACLLLACCLVAGWLVCLLAGLLACSLAGARLLLLACKHFTEKEIIVAVALFGWRDVRGGDTSRQRECVGCSLTIVTVGKWISYENFFKRSTRIFTRFSHFLSCKNCPLNRAVLVFPSVQKSWSRSCSLVFSSVQKLCSSSCFFGAGSVKIVLLRAESRGLDRVFLEFSFVQKIVL